MAIGQRERCRGERRSVLTMAPQIGHGNPLTAIALANSLKDAKPSLVHGPLTALLSLSHGLMTKSGQFSREYTKRSEDLRSGIAGIAIGGIQLAQWLANERLNLASHPLAEVGVFVQEHLLGVLPEELLRKWFPKGVFLFIPDVFPKESAVKILLEKKGVVIPLVWNRSAFNELRERGLVPILIEPVLPKGFLPENYQGLINKESRERPQKIVIKTSGSGISRELDGWLEQNIIGNRLPGQRIEYWQPQGLVIYSDASDASPQKQEEKILDLNEYGQKFYRSLLDVDLIISYPSEMIQVVAWLKAQGWHGKFFVLAPRGAHEKRNLDWAIRVGIVDGVYDMENITVAEYQLVMGNLEEELGKKSINDVINSLIKFRESLFSQEKVGISSEALKGWPSILSPSIPQELVIDSSQGVQAVDDFSCFFGIHYRRKEKEGFWDELEKIFHLLKEYQGQLPAGFYVSFHLEDLALLSDEELKEKLRWLEEKAAEIGIDVLFENTVPRVDRNLPKEFYSLIAFQEKYGELIKEFPHLGFCLDIAHLGLAEPKIFSVLAKWYKTKEEGGLYPLERLTGEERSLLSLFQSVLSHSKVIHWSGARGLNPVEKRKLFRLFQKLSGLLSNKELKEKLHNLYALLENMLSAHYPIATDSDLFVNIFSLLKNLGWEGRIVIESPAIFEVLRSHRRPLDYLERLQFLSSQAEIDLNHFSQGEISDFDLKDLSTFLEPEYSSVPLTIFPILKKAFPLLLSIYNGERRKVNGGLYLRHILKTGLIAYQLIKSLNLDGIDEERVVLSALFHDAFEMNPKYDHLRLVNELKRIFPEKDEDWFNSICQDVSFLTPPPKDPNLNYRERKRIDFERFIAKDEMGKDKPFAQWDEDKRVRFLVKVADVYANLYETVDDLKAGLDDSLMEKALANRFQVFEERVRRIQEILPPSSLIKDTRDLIDYLKNLLPN